MPDSIFYDNSMGWEITCFFGFFSQEVVIPVFFSIKQMDLVFTTIIIIIFITTSLVLIIVLSVIKSLL